ncbi:MAG: hypothetical protein GF329_19360 [Candidatus Lokiarchaeota archaeon]|nr:hypothetical protein [Candidatus Lokiarchaeota archaeon]
MSKKKIKIFGAALDPTDSEKKIAIKINYLNNLKRNRGTKHNEYRDSYMGFIEESSVLKNSKFQKVGRFPVETWLRTKPDTEDMIFMNPLEFRTFLDTNGCREYSDKMKQFIERKILPDIPLMIGADHSLTGGVLRALSELYGRENITVIIFDGHFDAIPTDLRLNLAKYSMEHKDEIQAIFPEFLDSVSKDTEVPSTYNCGTFLYYLLEDEIILPQNLILYGVMDYPDETLNDIDDFRVKNYVNFYKKFEEKGAKFIPNDKDYEKMNRSFEEIISSINTPYIYLSVDVDVGSLNAVLAARFMDFIGVDENCLINLSKIIGNFLKSRETTIIGMDIMEIEIFFINAQLKSGKTDKTVNIMENYLELLLID